MKFLWLAFVLGTILAWGSYVPMIHEGQKMVGGSPSKGALRAFLCVGLAYCVTAVLIPLGLFAIGPAATGDEPFQFNNRNGLIFSFFAGCLGAAGALGIVLAIKYGGTPLYVVPLVFAGAPIMNTIVSRLWKGEGNPGTLYYVGIVMAAIGAGLVLYDKGGPKKPPAPAQPTAQQVQAEETQPSGS